QREGLVAARTTPVGALGVTQVRLAVRADHLFMVAQRRRSRRTRAGPARGFPFVSFATRVSKRTLHTASRRTACHDGNMCSIAVVLRDAGPGWDRGAGPGDRR